MQRTKTKPTQQAYNHSLLKNSTSLTEKSLAISFPKHFECLFLSLSLPLPLRGIKANTFLSFFSSNYTETETSHGLLQQLVKSKHLPFFFIKDQKKATKPANPTTSAAAAAAAGDEVSGSEKKAVGQICGGDKRPFDQREALARNIRHRRGGRLGLRPSCSLHARLQGSNQLCLLGHAAWLVCHLHYLTRRITA